MKSRAATLTEAERGLTLFGDHMPDLAERAKMVAERAQREEFEKYILELFGLIDLDLNGVLSFSEIQR